MLKKSIKSLIIGATILDCDGEELGIVRAVSITQSGIYISSDINEYDEDPDPDGGEEITEEDNTIKIFKMTKKTGTDG